MGREDVSPAERIEEAVRKIVAAELARKDGRRLPLYELVIATIEKTLIEAVLDHERGNQSHAALTLGINRNTLRKKMRAHGIKASPR
jgi:Fis family transcriptional regulator